MRHPTKDDCFKKLKAMGTPIGTILDVGVKTCTYELRRNFPGHHHILMEPIVEWNDGIKKNYGNAGISYELLNIAVSDRDGDVTLKTNTVYEDKAISHARITDQDGEGPNFRTVPTQTLDSVVAARDLKKPYLLKVDVDGAELLVLSGAQKTLADCSVVVIETGIDNLVERAKAVRDAGFQVFDVVDISYYDDRFAQADMVFLNLKTIKDHNLGIYKDGFDIKKWAAYNPG